jgi:hypothetical protein
VCLALCSRSSGLVLETGSTQHRGAPAAPIPPVHHKPGWGLGRAVVSGERTRCWLRPARNFPETGWGVFPCCPRCVSTAVSRVSNSLRSAGTAFMRVRTKVPYLNQPACFSSPLSVGAASPAAMQAQTPPTGHLQDTAVDTSHATH